MSLVIESQVSISQKSTSLLTMSQSYNVNDDVAYVVAVVHWPTIEVAVAAGIHLCRSVLRMCKKNHIQVRNQ